MHGLTPPEIIADGEFHRFDGPEDKRGRKSASYVLHSDGDIAWGWFRCWKTGIEAGWFSKSESGMSEAEKRAHRERMDRLKTQRAAERARRAEEARISVEGQWEAARGVDGNHPYVKRKGIHPYGAKQLRDDVLVPLRDIDGTMHSVQRIYPKRGTNGKDKIFATGGRTAGCFCLVGSEPKDGDTILIAEGWATACSLHQSTGYPVFAAMFADNLTPVSKAAREKFPLARIILCADDDYRTDGNPGVTKATEAARAVGGVVAVPDFGDKRPDGVTDFNDLHCLGGRDGLEAIRACIGGAKPREAESEGSTLPGNGGAATAPRKRSGPFVVLTRACDIVPEPIYWLWPGYLPAGKFTAFAGPAGCGKTTIAIALAATVSCGGTWPDGTQCPEPGNVVIWTGEDGLADTLVPRLMAAGADLERVRFIESVIDDEGRIAPFDPSRDVPILSEKLAEIGGARLLIVDPIISAVRGDSHKAGDVRISLQPLLDLAAAHNCALLGITHFSKGSKGAATNDRLIGSQAFGASARVILIAGKDETSGRRVFMKSKANITEDSGGFEYAVEVLDIGDLTSSCVRWGEPLTGSASDILREIEADVEEQAEEADQASKLEQARCMLYEWLRPFMSTREMKAAAAANGVSWRTVEAAKKAEIESGAKITAIKEGGSWGWIWHTFAANHPDEVQATNVHYGSFGNGSHNPVTDVDYVDVGKESAGPVASSPSSDSTPQTSRSSPQTTQLRKGDCGVENQSQQGFEAKSATPQSDSDAPRAHARDAHTRAHARAGGLPENLCGVADLTGNPRPARDSTPQSSPQTTPQSTPFADLNNLDDKEKTGTGDDEEAL
ncbi:AAA family ATPase [Paraburkholderia adhaesiva]|uniref:AAA family ATPase n=1 Tax=Paraburkholderia adhaesiva TaxID=2883244 RepID=UPI001F36E0DB|nr:AAA family ATPase [Paraburkholderia adhaesiva]